MHGSSFLAGWLHACAHNSLVEHFVRAGIHVVLVAELVGHHASNLELVAAAVRLALHGHADEALRRLCRVQAQQEDGALLQVVVRVDQRILALAAAMAPGARSASRRKDEACCPVFVWGRVLRNSAACRAATARHACGSQQWPHLTSAMPMLV